MGPLPFAFSVNHFINSVGADAGFASIIGLAILVLLYFAQARETTSLRQQLSESGHRVQALEARLAQLARNPMAPAPPHPAPPAAQGRPATPGQPRPAGSPLAAPASGQAPAGQAAAGPAEPARTAAAAVPAPSRAASGAATAQETGGQPAAEPGFQAPAASTAAGRGEGRTGGTALADRPGAAEDVAAPAADRPGAPAGTGAPPLSAATRLIPNANEDTMLERPRDSVAAADPGPAGPAGNGISAPAPARGDQPPRIQIRPGAGGQAAARRPMPPPRPGAQRPAPPSRTRRLLAALIVLLAVAAVVVVLLVLTSTGGSSSSSSSAPSSNAPAAHHRARRTATAASHITVAVLNGTATSGLAHRVAQKLAGGGFKQGTVATAADQTRTATTVAYTVGHRRDAVAVASKLKLSSASVSAVDQGTQAVACPPPGACNSTVIVTVGSDLANLQ